MAVRISLSSVEGKLLLPVLGFALLLLLLIGAFYLDTSASFDIQIRRQGEDARRIAQASFAAKKTQTEQFARLIALAPDLADALDARDQRVLVDRAEAIVRFSDINLLTIYDPTGRALARGQAPSRFGDHDDVSPWVQALASAAKAEASTVLARDGVPWLLYGVRVATLNRPVGGVVVAGYRIDDDFLRDIKRRGGVDTVATLNGRWIAGTVPAAALTARELGLWPIEVGPIIDQPDGFGLVVAFDSRSELDAFRHGVMRAVMVLFSITALVTFCAIRVTQRLVTKPLGDMALAFTTLAGGLEEVAIPFVARNDEIGAMARAARVFKRRIGDLAEARAQQEIERLAKERAVSITEAKSAFLATMSHEIRTPLNGMLGMARLLQRNAAADQRELVDTMLESGNSLRRILDDILDFSKIEAGKLQLVEESVSISLVLDAVASLVEPRLREENLSLQVRVVDLPPWILGDGVRLRQVVHNLVGNAAKFTERGGITIVAEITEPGWYRISVTDTGIGIPAEALPRLFGEFEQVDGSTARRFGGTGLGLAICKRLIDAMGGRIGVESQPGAGSTFWFVLPCRATAAPRTVRATTITLPALTILLVEDNLVNQRVASLWLTGDGHRVDVAENGERALQLVQQGHYDVVLMDMQMPGIDGLEATRRIRAMAAPVGALPIIGMTANTSAEDKERCLAAGMNAHVGKPFDPDQLYRTMAAVLAATHGTAGPGGAGPGSAGPGTEPGATAEPARPAIDGRGLARMERRFGAAEARTLLRSFLADHLDGLVGEAAAGGPVAAAVRQRAHTIRGSAGTFGLNAVGDLAARLEQAGRAGDAAGASALLRTLLAALQAAMLELDARERTGVASDAR